MASLNTDIQGLDKSSLIFQLYDKLYQGMVDANKTIPLDPSSLGEDETAINKAISDYSDILMQNSAYNTAKSILDVVLKSGGGINIFTYVRTSPSISDGDAIISALGGKSPTNGNIVIITDKNSASTIDYGKTGFIYNNNAWENLNGRVDADNVIIRGDIMLAGNYTSVGNINKGSNNAAVSMPTDGISVKEMLNKIFSKTIEPSVTQPCISSMVLRANNSSGDSSVEIGTKYRPSWLISFDSGSYTYNPTNVSITSCAVSDALKVNIGTTISGTAIDEVQQMEANYTVTALINYSDGDAPQNNMHEISQVSGIKAGSTTKTASISGYRKIFYGYETSASLNTTNDSVRGLLNKVNAGCTLSFDENLEAKRIIIAAPKGTRRIIKVIMPSSSNADVTSEFKPINAIQITGANNYSPIDYDIWIYEPAKMAGTYQVTIS